MACPAQGQLLAIANENNHMHLEGVSHVKMVPDWLNLQVNDVTVISVMGLFLAVAAIVFGAW